MADAVTFSPVGGADRISSLDALRGFALLGILLMNITGMGMHFAAYDNPSITGGATGANLAVWAAMHVLAEGKMRALFSMMFGAGVVLMTSRLEETGRSAADVYLRRNIWLLLFGIAHAYLLWAGEILYPYALCSFVLYPLRNVSAKKLLIAGGVWLGLTSAAHLGEAFYTRELITKAQAAIAAEKAGAKLTPAQVEAKESWEEIRKNALPNAEELEKDKKAFGGGFVSAVKVRSKIVFRWHSGPYYSPWNWDIWGMMLLGMGLLKAGVITGSRSFGFYGKLAAAAYLVGVSLNSFTAWIRIQSGFELTTVGFTSVAYDLGRFSVAMGHMAILMILCKGGSMRWLTSRLAAVGQMALSNYVTHSVVAVVFFSMFGMYGRLQRIELYYVVAAIWIFQLIASPIWLKYFQYGPMEWAWRSLTYWKRQPMKVRRIEAVGDYHHVSGVS